MSFVVSDTAGRNDFEDEQSVRNRWWRIGPGDSVLDVGAALGSYTLPALAAGATVVSVCPEAGLSAILRANVAANAGFSERCTVVDVGLYERRGWLTLNDSADRYLFSEEKVRPISFVVDTLDSWEVDRLDWVKVDVEGHELSVLRGAERTIRRCRPRVIVENHLFMDAEMERKTSEFMLGLGLGYAVESALHHAVSHSFFEVR